MCHCFISLIKRGCTPTGHSSALGFGSAKSWSPLAVAPLLSPVFSRLSWLSILACSFFTSSSSSAWVDGKTKRWSMQKWHILEDRRAPIKKKYKLAFCVVRYHTHTFLPCLHKIVQIKNITLASFFFELKAHIMLSLPNMSFRITSTNEVRFSPGFVCLSLSNKKLKIYLDKFSGPFGNGTRKEWFEFWGDWKTTITEKVIFVYGEPK